VSKRLKRGEREKIGIAFGSWGKASTRALVKKKGKVLDERGVGNQGAKVDVKNVEK